MDKVFVRRKKEFLHSGEWYSQCKRRGLDVESPVSATAKKSFGVERWDIFGVMWNKDRFDIVGLSFPELQRMYG